MFDEGILFNVTAKAVSETMYRDVINIFARYIAAVHYTTSDSLTNEIMKIGSEQLLNPYGVIALKNSIVP